MTGLAQLENVGALHDSTLGNSTSATNPTTGDAPFKDKQSLAFRPFKRDAARVDLKYHPPASLWPRWRSLDCGASQWLVERKRQHLRWWKRLKWRSASWS